MMVMISDDWLMIMIDDADDDRWSMMMIDMIDGDDRR